MMHPLNALQNIILPAMEQGNYTIAPYNSSTSAASAETFIEAYAHDKETHTHYEWMWLLCGEGHMKIAGKVYRLLPGDFCFLPPLVPHADVYDRDTPAYTSLWCIHTERVLSFSIFSYRPLGQQKIFRYEGAHAPEEMGRVLVALQKEMRRPDAFSAVGIRGLLLQLAALCGRILESKQQSSFCDVCGPVSSQVIAFLQEHYARDLSLAEIARSTFLTPNYLSTLFKRETGISIVEALARIRIEHATQLLMENKMPVADVARAVGYNNLDRFSRVFRRHTGVAPRYYGKSTHKI